MSKHNWRQFFPFQDCRDAQSRSIDFAIENFMDNDKRFVIMELGTGVGKSAIGVCVSRYVSALMSPDDTYQRGAYFLTTQKILQEQYLSDFGGQRGPMTSIKSSANYQCRYHKRKTCAESSQMLRIEQDKSSKFFRTCSFSCSYKEAKSQFIDSRESITNFSYFMAETTYSGKLKPRDVLVIDEAHNCDSEMSKFIEISVSEKFAAQVLNLKMPQSIKDEREAFSWVKDVYAKKLSSHLKHIEDMFENNAGLREKVKEFESIAKQIEMLDKHLGKINRFIELFDEDNWVFSITETEDQKTRRLEFKPIDVSPYAEQVLFKFGKKVLMLSATILNHKAFCESLGIPLEQAAFITMPSPFPVENRPVIVSPIGKMSAGEIDRSLPKLVEAVRQIMAAHPNEKGIIHTHSYKISSFLVKNLRSKRFITHNSDDRDDALKKHIESKEPTILITPSMTEGVDLKGDLSRFQIICKVPYPYLGDKLIQKRMRKWNWWYPLQTAKTIIQSLGRSIRSADDHAVSYILDSDWDRFYDRESYLFPENFRESIHRT
jgi:ATP-dependent DNA helicase DinG